MAVESHPLRITERDVIKEQSVDEWFNSFKGLDLHVRVRATVTSSNAVVQQQYLACRSSRMKAAGAAAAGPKHQDSQSASLAGVPHD
jgi:hypothetical protein